MHGAAANAISVLLFGLSGLLLLASASAWAKLARNRERPDERPSIPVHSFRSAAGMTAATFVMLGIAVAWLALESLF